MPASDAALMERYRRGDLGAFDELYHRHAARLLGFLLRLTGRRELAEDLLQETFARVHKARASYDPARRFEAWIYTIALNLRRDGARRAATRAEQPLDELHPAPDSASPGTRIDVARALDALPEDQRVVVLLCKHAGMTHAEAARALDVTEGAVRMRLCRGLAVLRERLAPPPEDRTPDADKAVAIEAAEHRSRRERAAKASSVRVRPAGA